MYDDEIVADGIITALEEGEMGLDEAEDRLAERLGDRRARAILSPYRQYGCDLCEDTGFVAHDVMTNEGWQTVKVQCPHKKEDEANAKVKEKKENE